MGSQS